MRVGEVSVAARVAGQNWPICLTAHYLADRLGACGRHASVLTGNVNDETGSGVLVLNGTALTYVVFCPLTPGG